MIVPAGWSAPAIVPVDKGCDAVGRLHQSRLRFVCEDKTDMVVSKVVRAPGIHRRDRHVLLIEEPAAKVAGGDPQGLDIRDEEIATVRNDQSEALDRA